MSYLRLVVTGLAAFGSLSAASAADYYSGMPVETHTVPYHGGYAAGCQNCGPGGFSYGIGWGVPGCCDRPVSAADHLWDGYCEEKLHGGHCSPCFSCSRGSLFPQHYHAKGCTSGTSCTSGAGCANCTTSGGPSHPPAQIHSEEGPPAPPPAAARMQKPSSPKTSRVRTRGAI